MLGDCLDKNGCSTIETPGGCAQKNCENEVYCYQDCFIPVLAEYEALFQTCSASYTTQCSTSSAGGRNAIAWGVLAGASAAAIMF
jgi:hypothetical protein